MAVITITTFVNAQNKKQAPTKTTKAEIDRLFDKYKDKESITLFTEFGELNGNVNINYNSDEKPQSITILISTVNREAAAKFIEGLIQQKLNSGYTDPNERSSSSEFFFIEHNLDISESFEDMRYKYCFLKGNMYTKIITKCLNCESYSSGQKSYEILVETGDKSRFGGEKATKFDF